MNVWISIKTKTLKFFLRFELTLFQQLLRWWLGAYQATGHYLNQWWLFYWRLYGSLGLNELKGMIYISTICLDQHNVLRSPIALLWHNGVIWRYINLNLHCIRIWLVTRLKQGNDLTYFQLNHWEQLKSNRNTSQSVNTHRLMSFANYRIFFRPRCHAVWARNLVIMFVRLRCTGLNLFWPCMIHMFKHVEPWHIGRHLRGNIFKLVLLTFCLILNEIVCTCTKVCLWSWPRYYYY